MAYLDDLAHEIKASVPAQDLPDGDTRLLFRLYALLSLSKGTGVQRADVHNAWTVWMLERDPGHPSIKPFSALDVATQAADQPYVDAIRSVSRHQAAAAG